MRDNNGANQRPDCELPDILCGHMKRSNQAEHRTYRTIPHRALRDRPSASPNLYESQYSHLPGMKRWRLVRWRRLWTNPHAILSFHMLRGIDGLGRRGSHTPYLFNLSFSYLVSKAASSLGARDGSPPNDLRNHTLVWTWRPPGTVVIRAVRHLSGPDSKDPRPAASITQRTASPHNGHGLQ